MDDLTNKTLKLELQGGWRYGGRCTRGADEQFLWINDSRSGHTIMVRRDQILRMEVFDDL